MESVISAEKQALLRKIMFPRRVLPAFLEWRSIILLEALVLNLERGGSHVIFSKG